MPEDKKRFVRREARKSCTIGIVALSALALTCQSSGQSDDYEVVRRYPHDTGAYTQGLLFADGQLYESTGQLQRSQVRMLDLETGQVEAAVSLANDRFGEGLALLDGMLYQLTWKSNVGYVYDAANLARADSFTYEGEGWGLTTDGTSLIMSNGTATLKYLDPASFEVAHELTVQDRGSPLTHINELEYVDGVIYANIYQSDRIVKIDAATGEVQAWFNLAGLLSRNEQRGADVLNGIAYIEDTGNLLVTGKFWPAMFEIRLREAAEGG